ncbi:MAG TPA: hypothetical protein VKX16_14990 [Chloroflexota bacterium]|nr:hypothetical protein [Chloroflexota bacterium]
MRAPFAVRELHCKSAINRVRGMPFDWSINPYRGCRHACIYCYARPTHEYLGLNGGEEFQEVIFAKVNAPEVVRRELAKRSWRGDHVVIGTATDPYQQAESRYRITRGILEAFRDFRNPVSITTKSPMVLRDLDILAPTTMSGIAGCNASTRRSCAERRHTHMPARESGGHERRRQTPRAQRPGSSRPRQAEDYPV